MDTNDCATASSRTGKVDIVFKTERQDVWVTETTEETQRTRSIELRGRDFF